MAKIEKLPLLRSIRLMCALLVAMGLIACPLQAEQEKTDSVYLDTLTVIAPQPGVEITTDKTVIKTDEFKKPGEVRTLTDVLTEIGGVDVQRITPLISSPGDEVSIRGLNEGRMVIEIDGRRINHTGHMGRYIVDWSTLNMDDVERIEIIRGGHSVLHPFAIGGVINIITKKGKKTDELRPDVKIRSGYGDFDTYNLSASMTGGAANILSYHFSASRQETDGYLRNNFQETDSFNGHLTFHLPHEASFSIGAKYADVLYGFPVINDPGRDDYDSDYPDFVKDADQLRHLPGPQFPGDHDPHWEKHNTYLDAILQIPLGPGTFKMHGFITSGRRWVSQYRGENFSEDVFSDDETRGYIAEYRDIKLFDNSHWLTLGAEYQELGQPGSNPIIYLVKSAYIQDVIQLGKRWTLTPGVRYYHIDMDTYHSQFGEDLPTGGKEQTEDGFYPSLKADFQATEKTALYAAVSRSYRLPCP
ncbi:TonB-dependent receptor-like superfamily protein [Desulfonema magnum]|uniref:TonB-dependent receptor-like superfamily protein n=2 Tax=Desulfonema magnum TaxID=45655 RepID=A0A975BVV0_9BACT|nr:TonB-dependent receptor-like superfamily protein [Desulfonema magnum]